jgi:hypothetical protein
LQNNTGLAQIISACVSGNALLAIYYTQNQWSKLTLYLDDGRLNIDNNHAERAVKPFVIGRKA